MKLFFDLIILVFGSILGSSGRFFAQFRLNWHKSDCFTLYQAVFPSGFRAILQ
jgi:hypothetical protein